MTNVPGYLEPYLNAAQRHGGGFKSLLWASPQTQAARFAAIARLVSPAGRKLLDIGCGRADLLTWCRERDCLPEEYTGIEAVPALGHQARQAVGGDGRILEADFVANPRSLYLGADLLVISGSLNTAATASFYDVLRHAYNATTRTLVFNFLSSPSLAAASYLTWHRAEHVRTFLATLDGHVLVADDYLPGDTTFAIDKTPDAS